MKRIAAFLLFFAMLLIFTACGSHEYQSAITLMEKQEWIQAAALLENMADYKDSAALLAECEYNIAIEYAQDGDYESAVELLGKLGNYKDSADLFEDYTYRIASALYSDGEYEKALNRFEILGDYKDSKRFAIICSLYTDQTSFAHDFASEMEEVFAQEEMPYILKEKENYGVDEVGFSVRGVVNSGWTSIYFGHITTDWTYQRYGQINGFLVMGTASSVDEFKLVYPEFICTSAAALNVLDNSSTTDELLKLIRAKTEELKDNGPNAATEYVDYAVCEFDYMGYNCFISISNLGGDYSRLSFAVLIPEMAE